jgi:hypothetical protein
MSPPGHMRIRCGVVQSGVNRTALNYAPFDQPAVHSRARGVDLGQESGAAQTYGL